MGRIKEWIQEKVHKNHLHKNHLHKNHLHTVPIVIGVTCLVVMGVLFIKEYYTIENVLIEGNTQHTQEQIKEIVMDGFLGDNSIYLNLKYRNKEVEDIPFVEMMDVDIISHNTIKIIVYEKSLAGYIEYLGHYLYFDRDGIVVESSNQTTQSIPQVTGLDIAHVALYEPLPVINSDIFQQILNVTQMLEKYEITTDRIHFDSSYDMTLYFTDAKVKLGSSDNLEYKIMQLKGILPEIEDKKGTLNLENLTEDSKTISFQLE
ncbi:MAG: cell division protein FtsQ/DivIB [Eubacteriales bacterium]